VAWLILRPAEPADGLTGEDESRLRELLAKQGSRDSLGYFALRREKRVVWSPSGKAAITGRVVDGVFASWALARPGPSRWCPGLTEGPPIRERRHAGGQMGRFGPWTSPSSSSG
jgi:lysyl-tRNA synthetase class 2